MKMWEYALKFLNIPYRWGGSNPWDGLDCSGFIQEVLASHGHDLPGDQTAQGLHDDLSKSPHWHSDLSEDSILFFGSSKFLITHVAIAIDENLMVEAGGGGHLITSFEEAKKKDARIRVRPIRKDLVAALKFIK